MNRIFYKIVRKTKILPQKSFVKLHYKYQTGKKLNLENPKDFNEKIQWLKVYYKPPILTQLVDKYEVRSFISQKSEEKYLNEVYGVYDHAEAINFDQLPDSFILKATHGYAMNLLVRDKQKLDYNKARKIASSWLAINHYNDGMEWAYKNIKPRLIAEKVLEEKGKSFINDYKFFCFDGVPRFLKVDMDRETNHTKCYYDMEWNKLPFAKKGNTVLSGGLEKPENFKEMVALARKLSAGFPFVRVDLYNLDGKIVFGELTFYPADGRTEFEPEHYNSIIGDYLQLPALPTGKRAITSIPQPAINMAHI